MSKYLTPTVRRWLYVVSIAALPLLAYYGVIEPEALALWAPLLVAVLNVSDDPE